MKSPFSHSSSTIRRSACILSMVFFLSTASFVAALDHGSRTGELDDMYDQHLKQPYEQATAVVREYRQLRQEQAAREKELKQLYDELERKNVVRVENKIELNSSSSSNQNPANSPQMHRIQVQTQETHIPPIDSETSIEEMNAKHQAWLEEFEDRSNQARQELEKTSQENQLKTEEFAAESKQKMQEAKDASAQKIQEFKEKYGIE